MINYFSSYWNALCLVKQMKPAVPFLFYCLISITLATACNTNKDPVKEGTVFYFFPKENMYYDQDNDQYFLETKDSGWQAVYDLPTEQKDSLGEKVLLQNPPKPVWKNNAQDKLLYSLKAYTSTEDYRKKFYEDSINSLPKKAAAPTEDTTTSTKEKSRLGKFLEKIFSKKEKRDSQ